MEGKITVREDQEKKNCQERSGEKIAWKRWKERYCLRDENTFPSVVRDGRKTEADSDNTYNVCASSYSESESDGESTNGSGSCVYTPTGELPLVRARRAEVF